MSGPPTIERQLREGNPLDQIEDLCERLLTVEKLLPTGDEAGTSHDPATLGAESDPALTLVGQEFTLADVATQEELDTHEVTADAHHNWPLEDEDISDDPIPTTLRWGVMGLWSYSYGWYMGSSTATYGPAIFVPLARGRNWQWEFTVWTGSAQPLARIDFFLGYFTASNHVGGGILVSVETPASSGIVTGKIQTNDGDDTFTDRNLLGSGSGMDYYTFQLRHRHGVLSANSTSTTAWQHFKGRQSAGRSFTPAYVFLQALDSSGYSTATHEIKGITLSYYS